MGTMAILLSCELMFLKPQKYPKSNVFAFLHTFKTNLRNNLDMRWIKFFRFC